MRCSRNIVIELFYFVYLLSNKPELPLSLLFFSCNANYAGTRCQNCTTCSCPADQIQCQVGQWFCAKKADICNGQVKCGLSPDAFVKLCNSENFFD